MKIHIKAIIIAILFVFMMFLQASAQKKPFRNIDFSQHDFVDTIKIKIIDGALIVPVEINGDMKNFMFDTGANWGSWIGEKEDWMTSSGDSINISDTHKKMKKKAIFRMPSMKIGSTVIENYPVVADEGLRAFVCGRFDGVLGFDLVTCGLSFKFDSHDSILIVTDRKGFFAKEEKGKPFVKYKAYGKVRPMIKVKFSVGTIEMLFDTGYTNGWVDVPQRQLKRWVKKDKSLQQKIDEMTVMIDTTVVTTIGLYGPSYDTVILRKLHYDEVKMGKLTLNDVYGTTDAKGAKVGSGFLKHASLIIDGSKKRFVFLPHEVNRKIAVNNEGRNGFGISVAAENDTLGAIKVVVRKDKKLYEKGIRTGDYLLSINGIPVTCFCDVISLCQDEGEKRYMFRSPEGEIKEVTL